MERWEKMYRILACPECRGSLELTVFEQDAGSRCKEGYLACGKCQAWYPVTNYIPRLFGPGPLRPDDRPFLERWKGRVPPELKPLSLAADTDREGQSQVQDTFGFKWTKHASWGIDGESAKVMEEWLLPRYGWPDRESYVNFMRKRAVVLDAGCGLGREAMRMAQANPDALSIGLELSKCVDEAERHARERKIGNVFFVQGDIMAPPFKVEAFDFIISEGVLHHTPDTRKSFLSLARLLSKAGEFGFYVYRKKAPLREFADDYIRGLVKDLPPEEAWRAMEPLTKLGKALSDLKTSVTVPEDVPLLGIKAGTYDVQRLIYYAMFKCYWNDRVSFDENVHVNYDWYHPQFSWRHTETEVEEWLKEANLSSVCMSVEDSGMTVRAKR